MKTLLQRFGHQKYGLFLANEGFFGWELLVIFTNGNRYRAFGPVSVCINICRFGNETPESALLL